MLKIKETPSWILFVYQDEYQLKTNPDHLKQLFAFCCLGNSPKNSHFIANTILEQLKNQSIMQYFIKSFGDIMKFDKLQVPYQEHLRFNN